MHSGNIPSLAFVRLSGPPSRSPTVPLVRTPDASLGPIAEQLGSLTGTTPLGLLTSFSMSTHHSSPVPKHHFPHLSPLAIEHTSNQVLQSHSVALRLSRESGLPSQGCKHSRAGRSVQSAGSTLNLSLLMGSASVTRPPSLRTVSSPPVWLLKVAQQIRPSRPLLLTRGRPFRIAKFAKRSKPLLPPSPHLKALP